MILENFGVGYLLAIIEGSELEKAV